MLPEGLMSIGDSAFEGCSGLTELTLPDSITSLGRYTFQNCSNLESVNYPMNLTRVNAAYDNYDRNLFNGCAKLRSITVPEGVAALPVSVFSGCNYLEEVILPDSLTAISNYAFQSCQRLNSIEIADGIVSIGQYAFSGCTALKTVDAAKNLQAIGQYAFNGCTSLAEMNLGKDTGSIGNYAFQKCTSLADVYYAGTEADWNVISIGSGNENLTRANIHCDSVIIHPKDLVPEITIGTYGFIQVRTETLFSASVKADSAEVRSWRWEFGDGKVSGDKSSKHIYSDTGEYTVTVTVTDIRNRQYKTETTVQVVDVNAENSPYTMLRFTVCDAGTLAPIPGAQIVLSHGEASVFIMQTAADGTVSCITDNGSYSAGAAAEDYLLRTIPVSAEGGIREYTVGLTGGSFISGSLEVTEMTYDEIIAAGIDVNDEENKHVYKFAATFYFVAGIKTYEFPYEVYKNESGRIVGTSGPSYYIYSGEKGTVEPYTGSSGGWSWLDSCKITVYPITEKFALVIYGEAHWLKEMFQVSLVVHNDSMLDSLSDTVATLELPTGMSLAGMVSGQQSQSLLLGDIPIQGSRSAVWYVRGDAEGEYTLKASVSAVSQPNGDTVTAEFETTDPVKVYAGSALHLTISCEDMAERGKEYPVKFRLENVSDRSLYNLSFGLTGAEQYKIIGYGDKESWLPITDCDFGDSFTRNVAELAPGGYIEMELETTIWFNSALELIALTKLGAFVDVAYYLTDVTVHTMEGSTTEIPYTIVVERAEREYWIDWLIDAVTDELIGDYLPSGDLGGTAIEVLGTELLGEFVPYAKALLKLQQGETNYTLTISIDDGRGTSDSIENDVVRIVSGTEGQAIISMLNGTSWKLSAREASIQIKAPGSTKIKVGVENSVGKQELEYTLDILVDGSEIKDTVTLSSDGAEETIVVDEYQMKQSRKRLEEQSIEALKRNPFLWLDSAIEYKVEEKTHNSNNGYSVVFFNDDQSGGGALWTETNNRISVSGTTATLDFTRQGWKSLAEQSGEDYTIVARQLTDQEKQSLGLDGNVYEFRAESGNSKISSFGGESVIITVPYVLGEADNANELYAEHFKEDGTSEMLPATYDAKTKTISFATTSFSYFRIGNTAPAAPQFTDVSDPGAYYYKPVYWAAANGITTGTSDTTFSPNASCTRGQIVTFLWRAYGSPAPTLTTNPFRDVKAGAYYYEAVLWAVEKGITTGTSATTFSPNGACTRKQIVTFLWRAAGSPAPTSNSNPFRDVKTSDYFYDAVLWAVENSVTTGTSATAFSPNAVCSRGQCVTFLWRANGSPEQ